MIGLTLQQREILIYTYYLGYSMEQTANTLGIAPGTVKSRATTPCARCARRCAPGREIVMTRIMPIRRVASSKGQAVNADEIIWRDAVELRDLIRSGEVSAVEAVSAHLDRIEAVNDRINAFVTVRPDEALAEARKPRPGALSGVPITVKDSFDTAGIRTTRGSLLFNDRVPHHDATAVARLRAAGAVILGKTNLPEMSYWTESDNLVAGRSLNPYDPDRTPGGSSGGESAAIAAGMSPLGLGSDVAISLRGPAHDTGIAAIKPTHGRVPVTGHFPRRLLRWWHAGPLARSVRDLKLALSVLEGPDGLDPYATGLTTIPLSGTDCIRVGWNTEAFGPIDPDVSHTVAAAADALATMTSGPRIEATPVELPWLADTDHTRTSAALFGPEIVPYLRDVIGEDTVALHSAVNATLDAPAIGLDRYLAAELAVEELRARFAWWFTQFDVLLAPVSVSPAPLHARSTLTISGHELSARAVMRATVPFNLTGLPAISLPFGATPGGLPIGIQLVSRWGSDHHLLDLAERLERLSPVHGRRPAP